MQPDFIFIIIVLIMSVVIHEVSHGYAAQFLGDPTAKLAGRLTLNPAKHLDPMGSIIVPFFLVLTGAHFLIGWAKPVPYNPYNLSHGKWGEAFVAAAGPLVNLLIAVVFGLLMRFGVLPISVLEITGYIVFINILLALFNLLPIPPLDGSKVLKALLPYRLAQKYDQLLVSMMKYGIFATMLFLFIIIYLLLTPFTILVQFIFTLITGMSF